MSTVRPLIWYVIDEVVDVDDEIIRQLIEWDCNISSEMDRAIIYCLTQQFVERMASIANNVACVRTVHLHAHLDEDTKKVYYSHGFRAKRMLWWPLGSLGVGTIIHLSSSFMVNPNDAT
jgi:superfamily II DNA helicase RecQ